LPDLDVAEGYLHAQQALTGLKANDAEIDARFDTYRAELEGRELVANAVADRASFDVVKAVLPPIDTAAALYRVGVNGEYTLKNGITIGGAALGGIAGAVSKVSAAAVEGEMIAEGVVYSRIDLNGEILPYGGQAQSYDRYLQRQIEHARRHPDADFDFTIVDRADPGVDLDVAEHRYIQQLTEGVRASRSTLVSNLKDPVGLAIRPGLGLPEPMDS
jgi:hypothetical protein